MEAGDLSRRIFNCMVALVATLSAFAVPAVASAANAVVSTAPTIGLVSGTVTVGAKLKVATTGAWSGPSGTFAGYYWLRCPSCDHQP